MLLDDSGYDLVVVGLQEATFPVKSKATKHPKADESSGRWPVIISFIALTRIARDERN